MTPFSLAQNDLLRPCMQYTQLEHFLPQNVTLHILHRDIIKVFHMWLRFNIPDQLLYYIVTF